MTYYTTLDCLRLAFIMGLGLFSFKKLMVLAAGRRWPSGDNFSLVYRRLGFDSSWFQLLFNLSVMFTSCMEKGVSHGQKQCLVMLSFQTSWGMSVRQRRLFT